MTGLIPQVFIDELLLKIDIIDIIKSRIQLSRTGQRYKALCPFHQEKTPSFTVSQSKQYYYCFGCHASGNVITFLMNYERLEFRDAIELLANQAGLEIPQNTLTEKKPNSQSKQIFDLLKSVTVYYQKQLAQSPQAQAYLKSRGLSKQVIEKYQIGFAPGGWHALEQAFQSTAQKNALIKAGMLIIKNRENPSNQHSETYDRFRQRIMFPIRNTKNQIIAFGGRALNNDPPKYLNSPETPYFEKSQVLYGLHEARQSHRSLDQIIVVEGYMDVIGLAQFGITHVVATLGTALSSDHIRCLLRQTSHLIFCFDGDQAGRAAAWRALSIILPRMRDGLRVQFLLLPEGEDPDSIIRQSGQATFLRQIETSKSLSDFFFEQLTQNKNLNELATKAKIAQMAKEYLSKIPEGIFHQLMLQRLAQVLQIPLSQLSIYLAKKNKTASISPSQRKIQGAGGRLPPIQKAISLLLQKPDLIHVVPKDIECTKCMEDKSEILLALVNLLHEKPNLSTSSIMENFRDSSSIGLLETLVNWRHLIPESTWENELIGLLNYLKHQKQKSRIDALLNQTQEKSLTAAEKKELQALLQQHKR